MYFLNVQVLTNAQGTIASLVAPQTFDILGFYIAKYDLNCQKQIVIVSDCAVGLITSA